MQRHKRKSLDRYRYRYMDNQPQYEPVFPISPERFWESFAKKLASAWNERGEELQHFYNHDGTSWTQFITEILVELGPTFGCHVDTEYRKIDVVYSDKIGSEWDEWAMEAAIEIENGMQWTDEIGKLTIFNAGLKVLIAYEDAPNVVSDVLKRFIEINKSRKYVTANCAWLFIFGPRLFPADRDFAAFKSDGVEITEITGITKVLSRTTLL